MPPTDYQLVLASRTKIMVSPKTKRAVGMDHPFPPKISEKFGGPPFCTSFRDPQNREGCLPRLTTVLISRGLPFPAYLLHSRCQAPATEPTCLTVLEGGLYFVLLTRIPVHNKAIKPQNKLFIPSHAFSSLLPESLTNAAVDSSQRLENLRVPPTLQRFPCKASFLYECLPEISTLCTPPNTLPFTARRNSK